jgi:hypothetical protein
MASGSPTKRLLSEYGHRKPKRRKRSKIKRTDKKQSARFIQAAKELGLAESGEDFRARNGQARAEENRKRQSS